MKSGIYKGDKIMQLSFTNLGISTTFSKDSIINEYEPLEVKFRINGMDFDTEEEFDFGKCKVSVFDERQVLFELEDLYHTRRSQSFLSVNYINSFNRKMLKEEKCHAKTSKVSGRIAYIDRLFIKEEFRGLGMGSSALNEVLFCLKESFLVDYVLVFPYPFEQKESEENVSNISFFKDSKRLVSFYKNFNFEETYGMRDEFYMCLKLSEYEYKELD